MKDAYEWDMVSSIETKVVKLNFEINEITELIVF
jgi:hypothetical protein